MSDNITLPREYIDFAAHALEHFNKDAPNQLVFEIVHHLRAALAAPRPEPVAWMESPHGVIRANPDYRFNFPSQLLHWQIPLYTTPPAAAPEPGLMELVQQMKPLDADMAAILYANLDSLYITDEPAAAPHPEPVRHPGYVIGNHWLETAYERLCAGESEDSILEDYELVREPRLRELRRDAERYRWLRERAWFQFEFDGRYGDSGETVQQLDAAIDAAMQKGDKT